MGIYNIFSDKWEEEKKGEVLQMRHKAMWVLWGRLDTEGQLFPVAGQLWKETSVQPSHQSKKASRSSFFYL